MDIGRYVFIFSGILLCAGSCLVEREADFVIDGLDGEAHPLYIYSSERSGVFNLSKTKRREYLLKKSAFVPPDYSLEVCYSLHNLQDAPPAGKNYQIVLRINDSSAWKLPDDLSFLGVDGAVPTMRYAVPLETPYLKKISFEILGAKGTGGEMRLENLRLTERFYGFDTKNGLASPFTVETESSVLIEPDRKYGITGARTLVMDGIRGDSEIMTAGGTFSYIAARNAGAYNRLTVPAVFLSEGENTVLINGHADTILLKAALGSPTALDGPPEPITADPGFILAYPQDKWRDENFEIFRWESFPEILIFDTASYEAQDKLFKRLAFFAEKKGFKGTLARDEEIAGLHGWNAHDYSADTLARFFNRASVSAFPLGDWELALREILVNSNIIKNDGNDFTAGSGAVISISRESPEYLRLTFMTHEAYHGIFFIDAAFREFCRQRWEGLDRTARRFILSYFDFQQYDVSDSYLVLNEFMAHCLQQGVSASGRYFGENLANRMFEKSPWRRAAFPPKDEESGNWPGIAESFKRETAAFSEYAASRWGLAAGRVWRVRP